MDTAATHAPDVIIRSDSAPSSPDGGLGDALERAHAHVLEWAHSLRDRPVPPRATVEDVMAALGTQLPDGPTPAAEVIELLAGAAEPGLTAMPSGRFFGFVIGGTHPAALAADWLVSGWDQNCGLRLVTPAHTAVEDIASAWLLDLLGLPSGSAVGFVTGATMAQFSCLAAARDEVLRRLGWDVATRGLTGAPRIRVLVGAERHETVDLALRMLGLGAPEIVAVDTQGRIGVDLLRAALATPSGADSHRSRSGTPETTRGSTPESSPADQPSIVVLQAGNIHSGAFDPMADAITAAHEHGAWVHIDGAFGLWAAASTTHRHLLAGHADADSWSTDAHKTLNTPYDSGLAMVRDAGALRSAMGIHAAYLIHDEHGEPSDKTPELSRRGRAFPVWSVLRALGRTGVADLVDGLCLHAREFAEGLRSIDGTTVENEVPFTQVCASFGTDERTREVVRLLMADGTTWMTGSTWHGRAVLRISVSNWSTTTGDVERSLDAVRRAVAAL